MFGFFPLIPYVIGAVQKDNETQYLVPCLAIAAVLLFVLGFCKAALVRLNRWKAGVETLVLGGISIGMGYGVGVLFEKLVD